MSINGTEGLEILWSWVCFESYELVVTPLYLKSLKSVLFEVDICAVVKEEEESSYRRGK